MDIYQKVTSFYQHFYGEKAIIGKSGFGRNIYAVKVGCGSPAGIVQYAMHGREFITAQLAFLQAKVGVFQGSLWLIPLVNPDGALLSDVGINSAPNKAEKARLLSLNGGDENFALWKANGRGVDLNVNFPAKWGKGRTNTRFAGAENYIGEKPFSEPETQVLKRFTKKICPDYTVSYHTKGEEIYWWFFQDEARRARDERLALGLSKSTGYPLKMAHGSVGGYKDWCITRFKIPAFTIETGNDKFHHPIREEGLDDICAKNKDALWCLSKAFVDG